jgi:hypothetical protein
MTGAYRVSTFELASEHSGVGGGDSEIFVDEGPQVVFCL